MNKIDSAKSGPAEIVADHNGVWNAGSILVLVEFWHHRHRPDEARLKQLIGKFMNDREPLLPANALAQYPVWWFITDRLEVRQWKSRFVS